MTIYEKLDLLCKDRGISLAALAEDLGLNRATFSGWKRGAKPKNETVKLVADFFGVSVADLVSENPLPSISWVENTDLSGEPMFLNEREKLLVELFREASEIDRMRITHAVMEILKK